MGGLEYKNRLNKEAKAIWDRVINHLTIDNELYYESMYVYCLEMANYEDCMKILNELGRTQKSERTGYEQQRPEVSMAAQSLKAAREIAHKFGFDPIGNKKIGPAEKSPKEKRKTKTTLRKLG